MGPSGTRAPPSPPARTKRAFRLGARAVAAVLVVACGFGAGGMYVLLDSAEAHFRTADLAVDLHDDLAQMVDIAHQLNEAQSVSPALVRQGVAFESSVRGLLAGLQRAHSEVPQTRTLTREVDAFLARLDQERTAAVAGEGLEAATYADLADQQFAKLTPHALLVVEELRRQAYEAANEIRDLVVALTLFVITSAVVSVSWWARRTRRRAESAAADRGRRRFESMVEGSSDLIAVLDGDGRMAYASPSIAHLMGRPADSFIGQRWDAAGAEIGQLEETQGTSDFRQLLMSPGHSDSFEYTLTDTAGREHIFEAVATNLLDDPAMRGVILNSRDITDRSRLERELRASEEGFRRLFDDNPHPMWVFDNETYRFLQVNDAACQQYGYTRDEFEQRTIVDLSRPDDQAELVDLVRGFELDVPRPPQLWKHQTKDGSVFDVEIRAHPTIFEGRRATLVLAQDVTERRRLEAALEHRAFHDPLTELPNRALFRDRVQHALDAAPRVDGEVGVLMLDLDGFKTVNDTLGHAAGDELLDLAARRLETRLRSGDTIARMGGDEFAVLLENAQPGEAATLADRLLERLRDPFTVQGQEVFLTVSIGIAETQRGAGQPTTRLQLLRDADLAMYVAKDAGRDQYAVFEPRMRARTALRLTLQTDLQHALQRKQLCLYYQPTVRLDTLEIVGFEALLRWNHPERGLLSPTEFIPLAEETGLIVPIGQWILHEACRQVADWRRTMPGYEHLGIAINVSGRQLQGAPLVTDVREAVALAGLDPRAVTLEITESLLLHDTEAISAQLRALKDFGVHLAIDDFGTGYSSLSYLTRFPLDVMKLDKSFLVDTPNSTDRQALVRSIIDMGHSLHLSTLGEGIETESELAVLRACGCDFGQGFLFARPLTPEDATRRLGRIVQVAPVAV